MRNFLVAPTVIGILLASVLLLPVPQANHDLGPAFFGVYFNDPTVSFARPTGDATKTRSVASSPAPGVPGSAPATAVTLTSFGGLAVPAKITAATDLVASVWLSASYEVPLSKIEVRLQKASGSSVTNIAVVSIGGSNVIRGEDGAPDPTLTTVPERFFLALPRLDGPSNTNNILEIAAGSIVTIGIGVLTAGAEGQSVDVKLHYGSAQHPSGLVYGVQGNPGPALQGYGAGIYLDQGNKLTMTEPTAGVDLARASGNTGTTLTEAPEWEWGSVVVLEKFQIQSDGIFNVSLTMPDSGTPPAGARLVLQVNLYVGATKITGSTNYVVGPYVTTEANPPTPDRLVVALPLAGTEIPTGSTVKITFQLYAEQPGGTVEFLYGSAKRPSGLIFAATSSGGPTLPKGPSGTAPASTTAPSATASETAAAPTDDGTAKEATTEKKTPAFTFVLFGIAAMLAVALVRRRDS